MKDGYNKRYARMMTDHFGSLIKDGETVIGIPSFVSFAKKIGVGVRRIEQWKESYPEFGEAYGECLERQKQLLIDGALCKKIDSTFAKYYLTAIFGLGEEKEEVSSSISPEDMRLIENIKRRLDGE